MINEHLLINIFINIINIINYLSIDNLYKLFSTYFIKNELKKIEVKKIEIKNVEYEEEIIEHICHNCLKKIDETMYCYKDNYYCSENCRNKYLDKVEYIKNGYRK